MKSWNDPLWPQRTSGARMNWRHNADGGDDLSRHEHRRQTLESLSANLVSDAGSTLISQHGAGYWIRWRGKWNTILSLAWINWISIDRWIAATWTLRDWGFSLDILNCTAVNNVLFTNVEILWRLMYIVCTSKYQSIVDLLRRYYWSNITNKTVM